MRTAGVIFLPSIRRVKLSSGTSRVERVVEVRACLRSKSRLPGLIRAVMIQAFGIGDKAARFGAAWPLLTNISDEAERLIFARKILIKIRRFHPPGAKVLAGRWAPRALGPSACT